MRGLFLRQPAAHHARHSLRHALPAPVQPLPRAPQSPRLALPASRASHTGSADCADCADCAVCAVRAVCAISAVNSTSAISAVRTVLPNTAIDAAIGAAIGAALIQRLIAPLLQRFFAERASFPALFHFPVAGEPAARALHATLRPAPAAAGDAAAPAPHGEREQQPSLPRAGAALRAAPARAGDPSAARAAVPADPRGEHPRAAVLLPAVHREGESRGQRAWADREQVQDSGWLPETAVTPRQHDGVLAADLAQQRLHPGCLPTEVEAEWAA